MIAGALSMTESLDRIFNRLPEQLSVAQLTEVLGLSSSTVTYRWLRDGRVPAIQLGSHWVILRDDVKETPACSLQPLSATNLGMRGTD